MKKKVIVFSCFLLGGILAFNFLKNTPDVENNNLAENSFESDKKMTSTLNKNAQRHPSSINPKNTNSPDVKSSGADYFLELKANPEVNDLYEKTLTLFESSKQKEELARWISVGVEMDSSPEYGEVLTNSLAEINKDALANLELIEKVAGGLKPEDSFVRAQLLNLVYQMQLTPPDKIRFFGTEVTRSVALDKNGAFSPDSLNITTAMILLKNIDAPKSQIEEFKAESLAMNTDPVIQEKLKARFETYFE